MHLHPCSTYTPTLTLIHTDMPHVHTHTDIHKHKRHTETLNYPTPTVMGEWIFELKTKESTVVTKRLSFGHKFLLPC